MAQVRLHHPNRDTESAPKEMALPPENHLVGMRSAPPLDPDINPIPT
jgi:hypothetical protein